ncbi:MAG TPA: histidine phosphatase family protein [Anaerolineales bacterium]|nr:histidine phosphatase family protein [Anaerolineales bacterium]
MAATNNTNKKGLEMNRVYFVRHGEGQDNIARQFSYKRVDRSLTERGRLQARQTAEYLAGLHIDQIFCSSMKRAYETAQIIAKRLDKELTVLEEFREVNIGNLDGQDFNKETWGIYHDITNAWYAGNSHVAYPGGEDYVTPWERAQIGFKKVIDGHSNCRFVIVGHGGIFTSTLRDLCPGLEISWLQNVEYYHCAITELEMEIVHGELRARIVDWANYHHMSGEAITKAAAIPPFASIKRI